MDGWKTGGFDMILCVLLMLGLGLVRGGIRWCEEWKGREGKGGGVAVLCWEDEVCVYVWYVCTHLALFCSSLFFFLFSFCSFRLFESYMCGYVGVD